MIFSIKSVKNRIFKQFWGIKVSLELYYLVVYSGFGLELLKMIEKHSIVAIFISLNKASSMIFSIKSVKNRIFRLF